MNTRERDAYIAEHLFDWMIEARGEQALDKQGTVFEIPSYGKDPAAAFQMEDRISKLNVRGEYIDALLKIVSPHISGFMAHEQTGTDDFWKVAHATPDQRARACYEMLKLSVDRH